MNHRQLGTTGFEVTDVGLGTWNIGGDWGDVADEQGRAAITAALESGVNFLDTADVYGDGRSERLIREVLSERETEFPGNDHRNFNRDGEAFDVGETFAGVPFEVGLDAVDALRPTVPDGMTMAQTTLRWILDHDAVSTVIPGSTSPEHIRENVAAADLPRLPAETHQEVRDIYDEYVREHVHHRW